MLSSVIEAPQSSDGSVGDLRPAVGGQASFDAPLCGVWWFRQEAYRQCALVSIATLLSSKRCSLYESDDPIYVIDHHRAARSPKHHTSVRGLQEQIGLFVRHCPEPPSFIPTGIRADFSSDTHQLRIPRILDDRHAPILEPTMEECELEAMPATPTARGNGGAPCHPGTVIPCLIVESGWVAVF
jgi:hypothetical protein